MSKQDNRFNDYKLTKLDSVIINRAPTSDNVVSIKKFIDNELGKNTIVRNNQTLENYHKVSNGDDVYNLKNYNKQEIVVTTIIKAPNTRRYKTGT